MKIYISLPISGQDIEKVEASCIFASGVIEKKGHIPVSPLEVSPDPDASYAEHMGRDIKALLECNAVLLMDGWERSKGCQLEYRAAELYHKKIYFDLDDIKEKIIKNPKVGQTFQFESVKLRVEEQRSCKGCYFYENSIYCPAISSSSNLDCSTSKYGTEVIFKKVEG